MRWSGVLVFCAAAAYGLPIVVSPPCVTASLGSYITSGGGGGCSLATLVPAAVFDFGFVAGGGGPLRVGDITVTPSSLPKAGTLDMTGRFSAGTGDLFTYLIFYTIDPPPIIHGFEMELATETPAGGGRATLTTELCVGAAFATPALNNTCAGTLVILTAFYDSSTGPPTVQLTDSASFPGTGIIGVRNLITLEGGPGTSDIGGIGNTYLLPEPSTLALLAGGIALLLARRRR